MKSIIRNISILAIVIILGVIGYKVFFSSKAPSNTTGLAVTAGVGSTQAAVSGQSSSTSSMGSSASSNTVGQDFLTLLLSVQSIKLDDSIFRSKAFGVLQDFNRPIPPDTNPGRPDPFAPLGSDGSSSAVTVLTSNPSSITSTGSTLNGTLSAADATTTRWFEYGTTQALGTMTPPMNQTVPGAFAESINGLTPNTTYYVKASALVGGTTVSGNILTWKTALGGAQKK